MRKEHRPSVRVWTGKKIAIAAPIHYFQEELASKPARQLRSLGGVVIKREILPVRANADKRLFTVEQQEAARCTGWEGNLHLRFIP